MMTVMPINISTQNVTCISEYNTHTFASYTLYQSGVADPRRKRLRQTNIIQPRPQAPPSFLMMHAEKRGSLVKFITCVTYQTFTGRSATERQLELESPHARTGQDGRKCKYSEFQLRSNFCVCRGLAAQQESSLPTALHGIKEKPQRNHPVGVRECKITLRNQPR